MSTKDNQLLLFPMEDCESCCHSVQDGQLTLCPLCGSRVCIDCINDIGCDRCAEDPRQ